MESIDQKEITRTTRLTRVFLLSSLIFFLLAAWGPLVMMFQFSGILEEREIPILTNFILPIIGVFAMGVLVSLTFVRRVVLPVIQNIKKQFSTLGYVVGNQSSLITNFGATLVLGVIFGFLTIGDFLCYLLPLDEADTSLDHFLWNLLRCQAWNYSIGAFLASMGMVGFLWLFFQVRRVENETKQIIFVHYFKKAAASFWLVLLGVVVVGVVGYTFFQIFTLNQK